MVVRGNGWLYVYLCVFLVCSLNWVFVLGVEMGLVLEIGV